MSLMVACAVPEEVDRLHASLSDGEIELMPLGAYPFSKQYAWVQDKYGLSWQLMLVDDAEKQQRIRLKLFFSGEACGKAGAALDYYALVFDEAEKGYVNYYQEGENPEKRAVINYGELKARILFITDI
ncbi:VOC family protein [Muricomes intestini]|uniref:VOC family protein n=1 Tax=Muricomes intestini TaxID=1796634 RepID=UPI00242A644C|nr:VOC family protein [Muricomes intestini]